jgi:hypothetical protein
MAGKTMQFGGQASTKGIDAEQHMSMAPQSPTQLLANPHVFWKTATSAAALARRLKSLVMKPSRTYA